MRPATWRLALLAMVGAEAASLAAGDPPPAAEVAALEPAQDLVGRWRGVGQPKRGSSSGAWTETADWGWDFKSTPPALACAFEGGKLLRAARIEAPTDKGGDFRLLATLADDTTLDFQGKHDENGAWTFVAAEPRDNQPARISWKFVADGARLVVLLEARQSGSERYYRLAEVGYTRQGVEFAAGDGQPECVVTGGRGSMTVEHDGQTYYVCCTGCRELFESDPEGVLAEYRARQAEKKKRD